VGSLLAFFVISCLLSNCQIFEKAVALPSKEETTIIQGNKNHNFKEDSLTKTAFAYYDLPIGEERIIEEDVKSKYPEEEFYLVIDQSFFAQKSLFSFYSQPRKNIITYTVKEGDSPARIAAEFGISLNTLLWANNLKQNSIIKPGQELIILPITGIYHKVQKGETLVSIAKKYSASLEEIKEFNEINEDNLKEGQELVIPNGKMPISSKITSSVSGSSGLKPMTEDTSSWQKIDDFFLYPTSGGYNKGTLHYYNAVDIINYCGSPIYASADGIISETKSSGYNYGYGSYIKIQHFNGTMTVYAHLSAVLVKEGQRVSKGQLIGKMGDTGNSNGCHLHFEVRGAQNPFILKK